MQDLDNRGAIHDLVIHFYREVVFDDLLGPVFGEVAEVDWAEHIPRLIGYWCRVLLDHASYDGRILAAHERVHAEQRFDAALFDRWYRLFAESVDGGWSGTYADRAKGHAAHMAGVISRRLTGEDFDIDSGPSPLGVTPATCEYFSRSLEERRCRTEQERS